mmetsp:Transcript_77170/g.89788  ORF Transcript_77170/g.89788 Transcript_77170/m.89788 type:complete len:588 (-) Transcript_77170:61-1824(-)
MIEELIVITTGGVVAFDKVWSSGVGAAGGSRRRSTVNTLIREYLLEDRVGDRECIIDELRIRWCINNDPGFMVIVMYSKTRQLMSIDEFLSDVRHAFREHCGKHVSNWSFDEIVFAPHLEPLYETFDARERAAMFVGSTSLRFPASAVSQPEHESGELESPVAEKSATASGTSATPSGIVMKDGRTLGKRGAGKHAASIVSTTSVQTQPVKKPTKKATVWNDNSNAHSDSASSSTGPSSAPTAAEIALQTEITRKTFVKLTADGKEAPVQERVWEGHKRGKLASWLRSYVGTRELDAQDFAGVLPSLREKLISKNVAVEVAEHVCSSIEASLTGKKIGTFESLHQAIEDAMVDALRRILHPKVEVNILRSVAAARVRMRPYSIVFCGVNGVGKSTSLSKITYWLQQNNHSVLIAAGDTFRHGAVEQLEVHGRCLNVPIFQLGYGTDPSAVAAAAIAQAARQKTDVVLIDTAGRMQDHESRMRALAKLIHDNQPDLVLFVGEALVGNNGVDQLRKFNQCLFDFTPIGSKPRGIDGIVLTKFDTIDDKVGAALTMVYELGQPIVFVGVGQTYQDLKVIDADVVVSALMQ